MTCSCLAKQKTLISNESGFIDRSRGNITAYGLLKKMGATQTASQIREDLEQNEESDSLFSIQLTESSFDQEST